MATVETAGGTGAALDPSVIIENNVAELEAKLRAAKDFEASPEGQLALHRKRVLNAEAKLAVAQRDVTAAEAELALWQAELAALEGN